MAFSQKLQEYRKTKKLSQEELAHQLGVSRQSVSKWEQGLSFPETEKLIELSSLMGVTVDSLLKGDALPTTASEQGNITIRWLVPLLVALLIIAGIALVAVAGRLRSLSNSLEVHSPKLDLVEDVKIPSAECEAVEVTPAPDGLGIPENGFENKHLHELQRWFFDFAREYRLDYMPYFTQDEGAPTDSGEYLYWAYAINIDNRGDSIGTMTKDYVEETVHQHFGIIPGQHRSHRKSWDFNAETGTYVAWPESLREKPYYLLNSIEVHDDRYTIHATCYSADYLPSEDSATTETNPPTRA